MKTPGKGPQADQHAALPGGAGNPNLSRQANGNRRAKALASVLAGLSAKDDGASVTFIF